MICKKCLIDKNISEFYYRKDTNKYRNICISCDKKRIKKYAIKNSEHIKKYQKEYFNKNKEKLLKNQKEYFKRTYVHKGYKVPPHAFKKGHVPWHKGKVGIYSNEALEKMSKAKKGKVYWMTSPLNCFCDVCKKHFHKKPSCIKKKNYCSRKCLTVATKERMNLPEVKERMKALSKNRIYTKEYRLKCSERFSGCKHPQWKGGITSENKRIRGTFKYKEWREEVFKRDNWTCQMCMIRSKKNTIVYLHPHHIKAFAKYPSLRFEVSNGITLCKPCHLKLHKLLRNTKEVLKNV